MALECMIVLACTLVVLGAIVFLASTDTLPDGASFLVAFIIDVLYSSTLAFWTLGMIKRLFT